MKTLKVLFAGLVCGVMSIATVNAQSLEKWASTYPTPANNFASWVQQNPANAKAICDWDVAHPDHSKAFVTWVAANPDQDLSKFCQDHTTWTELHDVLFKDSQITAAFMKMCIAYTPAINALMAHPGGLKWASEHVVNNNK